VCFSLQKLDIIKKVVHKGELLRIAVEEFGMPIAELMKRMGYRSRNTYYTQIKQTNLSDSVLKRYGKVIHHDFAIEQDIPIIRDKETSYTPYFRTPETIEEAIRQRDYYLKLYIQQLEENRALMESLGGKRG